MAKPISGPASSERDNLPSTETSPPPSLHSLEASARVPDAVAALSYGGRILALPGAGIWTI